MKKKNYQSAELTKSERRKLMAEAEQVLDVEMPPPQFSSRPGIRLLQQMYYAAMNSAKPFYLTNFTEDGIDELRDKAYWKEYRRRKMALMRLKRSRLIEIEETEDGLIAFLTDEGKIRALKKFAALKKKKLPNDQFVIVIFDIPERARVSRDLFRRFLYRMNFEMVQKSVWMSPYDTAEEVKILVDSAGAGEWFDIFIAKRYKF
jgi:hypothetical protein